VLDTEEFSGKEGEMATFYRPAGYEVGRVILLGLGEKARVDADSFRRAMGRAGRYRPLTSASKAAISFTSFEKPENFQAAIEGYLLGGYQMLEYKTGESARDDRRLDELVFISDNKAVVGRMEKAVSRGTVIGEGQMLVRRLASTPSNDLTPTLYAEKAKELAKQYGFECRVLDEAAIKREKMGAFLAVTRGSEEPPRFIILTYKGGPENQKPIVLVGKGITFDSGGISLKPGLNMHEMKQDMAGSAVVVGTVVTAARLGINRNIIGLVPTCENMPSGHATRPGDIVRSRKGKTVEIINTDAEGRLILADALDYAGKFDPQAVIDIATLTGAALYILGYAGAPILGNNESLLDRIREASASTAERVWPLPIWDDQREQMKSEIADLVNSGGRPAGTAAAAAFLENFIGEWPWAHIDIASVDLEPKGKPYIPKGASGFGVRLLTELLSNWKKL
jgi:leucyl aminopeptidase